ncbi:MAG TPA: PKD domain-containing protein, partial [bacterium]|nr:PKD domain-containing protein [bacterium]
MRSLVPLCLAGLGLVAAACSGNSPAAPAHAPAGSPALAPTYSFHPGGESLVAQFRLTIDPAALTATAEPVAGRSGQAQPPQALSYDLDIANFLKPDSFEVTSVGRDVAGDLTLGFIHRHPFPAPDFSRPISGQNRADLGYTGRLLVLADVNTRSFFGDVTTDPTLVKAPDGYLRTGDLLAAQGLAHNTFPYVLLADDGEDNRITATNNTPLSNGGTPQGTYDPAVGGWQRSNIGAGLGWTGYDYLHAGQGATNTLTLYASAMSAAPLSLDVVVLIKYTDPRGQGGRSLRFPPVDFDVTQFAYRLPYAALDASKISRPVSQPIPIATTTGATAQVVFDVRDWDKAAAEAADANLSDEFDVTLIEPGASGVPTAELQVPALNPTPAIILPTTTSPTGMPGNEIPYAGSITKTLGGGSGVVWGLLRVTDPSHTTDDSAYHFGVDPASIIPSASRALDGRTYQAIPFSIGGALNPPQVLSVSPTGIAGCPGASVTFGADVTNSPSTWSWNFGGGATPNTSVAPNPVVTLGAIGTYNGTLTVTNGAGSSGPFSFSYTIGASAWAGHFLPSPTGGEGHYPSVVIYNGKPAVASVRYGGGSNDLQIAFASTGGPSNGGEWSGHTIASYAAGGSSIDTSCDLELLNGRLAVLFKNDATNRLSIAVATVTSPAVPTASDWVVYEIDSTVTALRDTPALTAHNGKLAAAYGDESPDDLWLAQA